MKSVEETAEYITAGGMPYKGWIKYLTEWKRGIAEAQRLSCAIAALRWISEGGEKSLKDAILNAKKETT